MAMSQPTWISHGGRVGDAPEGGVGLSLPGTMLLLCSWMGHS